MLIGTTIALLVISAVLLYCYLTYESDKKYSVKAFFSFTLHKPEALCVILALCASVALFFVRHIGCKVVFLTAAVEAFTLLWLGVIAYIDLKKKIIPNKLLLCGVIFWGIAVAIEVFAAKIPAKQTLTFSLLGALIIGGILLVIALLVKTALGMGDVKLFTVLGLLYGLFDTYSILLYTIIIMAVISVILLIAKKVDRKTAVPMAPFAVLGFLINVLV